MKIYDRVVLDMRTMKIIEEVAHEYHGKVAQAVGWTNRAKYVTLDTYFRGAAIAGTGFAIFLATSAQAPSPDFNVKTEMTEIATGNGYDTAGGMAITRNSTDFDVLTEDDTNDWALVQLKNIVWTASGGPIPASGNGARYAVLTDQNATVNSRLMLAMWDLVSDRTVSSGQTLTLVDCELRLTES